MVHRLRNVLIAVMTGFAGICTVTGSGGGNISDTTYKSDGASVAKVLDAVAFWQMKNLHYQPDNPHDYGIDSWSNSVFYLGLSRWAPHSGFADRYFEWLLRIGEKTEWQMPDNFEKKYPRYGIYHADELCIGQFYIAAYEKYHDPEMIALLKTRLHRIIANPPDTASNYRNKQSWTWCDALFMAPAVYAGISNMCGNAGYMEFMDSEFRKTYGNLYDKQERLFFRDDSYFDKREANGEKIFWGRGNGWVVAGIANVLDRLPAGSPYRAFYEELLKTLSYRLIGLQDKRGYWHASLLDPESFPAPETSATALITYAMAYGINNGILSEEDFLLPVMKAWGWMESVVDADGKTGWIQPIGADPRNVTAEMTAPYGAGALLLAGNEIYKITKP